MINFDFYTPTRVLFGADRENEAGKQVAAFGGHKVMIIYGKKGGHVESSGLFERVHQSLNGAGLSYIDFSGVVPNPRLSLVKEGIRIGRSEGVDFLLPIGGGSVICPGVEIGDNTVIGAGSVVVKSIPANVMACGNPCVVKKSLSND